MDFTTICEIQHDLTILENQKYQNKWLVFNLKIY